MSVNIKYSSGARTLQGLTSLDDYSVTFTQTPSNLPGSTTDGVTFDALTKINTYAGAFYNYPFEFTFPFWQSSPTLSVVSGNASISGSQVTATGVGSAVVESSGVYGKRRYSLQMAAGSGYTQTVFNNSYVAGSLSAHIQSNLLSYVNGKTPSNSIVQRFTSVTPAITAAAFQAVKNANLTTGALDLSWLSVRRIYPSNPNWDGGGGFPAAVISKRHIICARHVGAAPRTIFQKQDGAFVQVDLISGDDVIVNGQVTDCKVYYVNADLTGLITPVLFVPTSGAHPFKSKLPMLSTFGNVQNYGVPALISLNNESTYSPVPSATTFYGGQKMLIANFNVYASFSVPGNSNFSPYYYYPFGGDSSSMVFFPINQSGTIRPVLLSSLYTATSGPNYCDPATQASMVALMRTLAVAQGDNFAYDLTYADLSAFTSF